MTRTPRLLPLVAVLTAVAAATADARVSAGDVVPDVELSRLGAAKERLLSSGAKANVIIFWRPGQSRSEDTLQQLAACEAEFAGKPVRFVTIVSDSADATEVKQDLAGAELRAPVLLDQGDELYGSLGIRQHPLVIVADGKGKIALVQPYLRLRYCDVVIAHVRRLLGEIDDAQLKRILSPPPASFPNDDKHNVARRYLIMGRREAAGGHCDRALASFDKALAIVPGDPEAIAGKQACAPAAAAH